MPAFGPVKHRELVRSLQQLGFAGPFSRGKHLHMKKGNLTLTIPNPHKGDISVSLLSKILKQAGISRDEWEKS